MTYQVVREVIAQDTEERVHSEGGVLEEFENKWEAERFLEEGFKVVPGAATKFTTLLFLRKKPEDGE